MFRKTIIKWIPNDTKDITFSYNPAFMQGGERLGLKFETDSIFIYNHIRDLSDKAKSIGKYNNSEPFGLPE